MKIRFLKAHNGDCIHINFTDDKGVERNIIIDGGIRDTYIKAKDKKLKRVAGELYGVIKSIRDMGKKIDLLILTHHHDDHIKGVLHWLETDRNALELISEVWFNTGAAIASWLGKEENDALDFSINMPPETTETSIPYAILFRDFVKEKLYPKIIIEGTKIEKYGVIFYILSPDKTQLEKLLKEWKTIEPDLGTAGRSNDYEESLASHISHDEFEEDASPANGSSIAFRMEWRNKNFLFLADAHPNIIYRNLLNQKTIDGQPIKYELVKLSHHGSEFNTSPAMLREIISDNFVISTNGEKHQHPHKRMLARLIGIKPNCKLHFNYESRMSQLFSEQDKIDFPAFQAIPITTAFIYDDN